MFTMPARALAAAAFVLLPHAAPAAHATSAVPQPQQVSLASAISRLPVAEESRDGYVRSAFKHWVDDDHDGCSTRAEVLISEARTDPVIKGACQVTGGSWFSYYDGKTVTEPRSLDIDHMVPLAEAWGSGASAWSGERREDYANDLDAERSLVAVTAKAKRSKADQDPAEWLPPLADARCTYAADWISTKLRWKLSADRPEIAALRELAEGCGHQQIDDVRAVGATDAP
ncbi:MULTISPECIES: HNH endonuclease family protein [unclassified Streptomyces]|uniref:HNH endonuclease family protein n=1 Tax=unclassified Streptomyces TaxID=2593676 RepID=UPI0033E37883